MVKGATSIFREARAIAAHCPDQVRRDILRARVDECHAAYDVLVALPTRDAMQNLVACWTRLSHAIDAINPLGGNDPPAGRLPQPKSTEAPAAKRNVA